MKLSRRFVRMRFCAWALTGAVVALVGPLAPAGVVKAQRAAASADPWAAGTWLQWGGPNRDFLIEASGLADKWPETGPPVLWSRPLGTGHSAIIADEGRLYTMYRAGNGKSTGGGGRAQGPFEAEEAVIALDAKTGQTIWEHKYPSRREDFSFGAGPHSTPLIAGDRLFTIGTNQQMFAFDKRTGKVLWSHDFIKEFRSPELLIRPVVKTGYGCSPIAYRDTIICSVGGPGQSVMAFRQSDGGVVWKSGHFLTSAAPPILIDFGGRPQLVFLAGGTVTGLDPNNGTVLWSTPHDPGNDLNCNTPIWGADNILFVSSAYKAGSRAIQLKQQGAATHAEELWFTNRVRFMFLNAVRLGDFVYGTTGDFGPAFLTALNIKTGQPAWQHRGFGRASIVYADGKAIIMDEDGDLALARLAPEGATILSEARIFDTTSWTVPTLVGTTLFARDRQKIVALELGKGAQAAASLEVPKFRRFRRSAVQHLGTSECRIRRPERRNSGTSAAVRIVGVRRRCQQARGSSGDRGTDRRRRAADALRHATRERHGHHREPDERRPRADVSPRRQDVDAGGAGRHHHDDLTLGRRHARERRQRGCAERHGNDGERKLRGERRRQGADRDDCHHRRERGEQHAQVHAHRRRGRVREVADAV